MINPFNQINRAAFYSIEKTLNLALNLDPNLKTKLLELHGTSIGITFTLGFFDRELYLLFKPHGIDVKSELNQDANLHIQGNPLALIRLLTAENKQAILFSGDIKIFGDSQLLFKLQTLFAQMDIDWENIITLLTGDILGHQISRIIRKSLRWGKQASHNLVADLEEYLHEEIKVFPTREELEVYFSQIDEIKLAVDRLQAKLDIVNSAISDKI